MTTITEICDRLKLLAFNATIEGGLAGETEQVCLDITKKYNELVAHATKYQQMLRRASKESVTELKPSLAETQRQIEELTETLLKMQLPTG